MSYSISISIVTYKLEQALLKKTLESLIEAIGSADKQGLLARDTTIEIRVIDNGNNATSIGGILDSIKEPPNVKLEMTSNERNVGYGKAHNQAILGTNAEIHLILNPDVELDRDSLRAGLLHLAGNPQSALLGPSGTDYNHNPARLAKRYPTLVALYLRGFAPGWLKNRFAEHLAHYEYQELDQSQPAQVTLLSGCMMLGRTELLQKIGGFDPSFFLYFEDFDLSLRAATLGHVIYLPTMKITHHGGRTASKGPLHIAYFVSSAIRFFNKHGWRFF